MEKGYYKDNAGMIWQEAPNDKAYIWRYDGNPLFDIENHQHYNTQ